MKKINPVLRYPGSKFRKIETIINHLEIKKDDFFFDMFGGSMIVGVNVKQLINCKVLINDYDCNVDFFNKINDDTALKNMLTFEGNGKSFTAAAHDYFIKRIDNDYWKKLDEFNEVLNACIVWHHDYREIFYKLTSQTLSKSPTHIYVDPPYVNIKNLYKASFNDEDHITLAKNLKEISEKGIRILISYNDTPLIRELYKDWNIEQLDFTYTSTKRRKIPTEKVKELLICNYQRKVK